MEKVKGNTEEDLLSREQLGEFLGLSPRQISRWMTAGLIPRVLIGNTVRFRRVDVLRFLDSSELQIRDNLQEFELSLLRLKAVNQEKNLQIVKRFQSLIKVEVLLKSIEEDIYCLSSSQNMVDAKEELLKATEVLISLRADDINFNALFNQKQQEVNYLKEQIKNSDDTGAIQGSLSGQDELRTLLESEKGYLLGEKHERKI